VVGAGNFGFVLLRVESEHAKGDPVESGLRHRSQTISESFRRILV